MEYKLEFEKVLDAAPTRDKPFPSRDPECFDMLIDCFVGEFSKFDVFSHVKRNGKFLQIFTDNINEQELTELIKPYLVDGDDICKLVSLVAKN